MRARPVAPAGIWILALPLAVACGGGVAQPERDDGAARAQAGPAQAMYPRERGHEALRYHPEGTDNGWQVLDLYTPEGEPPPEGWPCLARIVLAGFLPSGRMYPLLPHTELEYLAVQRGVAVVGVNVTPSDLSAEPIPGAGVFRPPSSAQHWSLAFSETDVVHAVQHLKHQGSLWSQGHGQGLPIDPARIVLAGSSAGGMAAMWVGLGPDRSDPSAQGQRAQPTRVQGLILGGAQTFWPAFRGHVKGHHFHKLGMANTCASELSEANPAHLRAASPLVYGFRDPQVAGLNARLPVFLEYGGAPGNEDFEPAYPHRFLSPGETHDSWFGLALWTALGNAAPGAGAFHSRRSGLLVFKHAVEGENVDEQGRLPRALKHHEELFWLCGLMGLPRPTGCLPYRKREGAPASSAFSMRGLWCEGAVQRGEQLRLCAKIDPGGSVEFMVSSAGAEQEAQGGATWLVDRDALVQPVQSKRADAQGLARLDLSVPAAADGPLFVQAVQRDGAQLSLSNGLRVLQQSE